MQALILAGLLVTQIPTPPPSYRAALAARVAIMIERAASPPRVERPELARRLAAAALALDGREALTGRRIARPE